MAKVCHCQHNWYVKRVPGKFYSLGSGGLIILLKRSMTRERLGTIGLIDKKQFSTPIKNNFCFKFIQNQQLQYIRTMLSKTFCIILTMSLMLNYDLPVHLERQNLDPNFLPNFSS